MRRDVERTRGESRGAIDEEQEEVKSEKRYGRRLRSGEQKAKDKKGKAKKIRSKSKKREREEGEKQKQKVRAK